MYKRVYFALSACQAVLKEPNDAPTRLCKYGYRKRWLPWHNIFILFFAKNKSTKQTNKPASTQTHSPTIRHKVASHLLGISLSLKKAFASGSQDNGSNRWKTEKLSGYWNGPTETFFWARNGHVGKVLSKSGSDKGGWWKQLFKGKCVRYKEEPEGKTRHWAPVLSSSEPLFIRPSRAASHKHPCGCAYTYT